MLEERVDVKLILLPFFLQTSFVRGNMNSVLQRVKDKFFPSVRLNKSTFKEMFFKEKSFTDCSRDIEVLALGSSHGAYGFDSIMFPEAFNGCSTSQDLYYSYQLYNFYQKNCLNLKRVFLFFSVFSFGYELQKSRDAMLCAGFNYFYKIPYKHPCDEDLRAAFKAFRSQASKVRTQGCRWPNGYYRRDEFFSGTTTVESRVEPHLRENLRKNDQISFLLNLQTAVAKNKQELFLVLSPARKDYKEKLPPSNELFGRLLDFEIDNIVNMYDVHFESKYFGDFDHLNCDGAKFLTQELISTCL